MSDLPKYLQRLDEALFDLPEAADGMLLSEVDGFLTGIALIPVEIPTEEWLPLIWRPNPDTPDYLYHDQALLEETAKLALQHHRMLARDLHQGEIAPIYNVDQRHDETLWEIWIEGFSLAMSLRPDAFASIGEAGEDVQTAFLGLQVLCTLVAEQNANAETAAEDGEDVDQSTDPDETPLSLSISAEERAELSSEAPDAIPAFVQYLYDWTRTFRPTPDFAVPVRALKVGRNDPCSCGSGRKYKKCCGAAA